MGPVAPDVGMRDNVPREQDNTPREDAPVIAVLSAVKASDLDGFRNAYSKRIREDVEQGDMGEQSQRSPRQS